MQEQQRKSTSTTRQKCKNGASCPFQVCGNCWFVHDGDAISTVNQQAVKASSTPKTTQHSSELLLNKLTGITTEFEKKLVNLSQSIDLRLAAFESKLEAMADAILRAVWDLFSWPRAMSALDFASTCFAYVFQQFPFPESI